MSEEQKNNFALWEAELNSTDKKLWLSGNFELYKITLIWPPDLPPFPRCNMPKGAIRERFNSTYKKILSEYYYKLDNERQTFEFN